MEQFNAKYPDITIHFEQGNHEELYNLLRTEMIDIVLNDQRRAFSDEYINLVLTTVNNYIEISSRNPIGHVGVNYGGRLFGTVHNKNFIGVEMCVQAGYDFHKAFANAVIFFRQLMAETGIPADRVLQHYDVGAKNCPSQIRAKGMWEDFKRQRVYKKPNTRGFTIRSNDVKRVH